MIQTRKSDLNQQSFEFTPSQLYTNSTCKITFSFRHRAIPLSIEWLRISSIKSQLLTPIDLNTYQCSPLDLGCYIEARIVYKTDNEGKCTKIKGPVMLDPQVQQLITGDKVTIQSLKAQTTIQGVDIPINFKLKPDVLSMNCIKYQSNCQYLMKLEALPQFKTKVQTNILTFSVKNYSQIISKYFSAILKVKTKNILEFDVKFQSRLHRDLFLVILNKKLIKMPLFKIPLSQQQSPFVHPAYSTSSTPCSNTNLNANISSQNNIPSSSGGINSGFTYHNLIPSSTRINSNTQIASHNQQSKSHTQTPQNQVKQLRQTFNYIATPQLKNQLDNLFSNQPPKRQKQYLNIFQDSVLSDEDAKQINLQNSFILYQSQKQISPSPLHSNETNRSLKTSSIHDKQKSLPKTLEEAIKRIDELMSDNYLLKQQNKSLNMELIEIKSNKKVDLMKQKIKMLEEENSKLINDRNKLVKDCSNYDVKFSKQETEKMIMKEMLESLKGKLKDQNESIELGVREKSKEIGEIKSEKKRDGSPTSHVNVNSSGAYGMVGKLGDRLVIGGGFTQATGARVYTHINQKL